MSLQIEVHYLLAHRLNQMNEGTDFFQQFSWWSGAVRKTLLTRMRVGAGWEGVYVWASYSSYIHNHTRIP